MTAGTPPRARRDLRSSVARLAAALLDLGRTRFELAAVEFEEARARAAENLVLVMVAGFSFAFAILVGSMLVVVLFWDTHRIGALCAVTLVYVLIGVVALWRLSAHRKAEAPAFAATLAELERDRASLASRFGVSEQAEGANERGEGGAREKKALLVTRAELDRQRVALAVYDLKSIVSPSSVADRAESARPLAATVIALAGPFVGPYRLRRWLRYASFALVALRLARSWRAKPR